MGRRAEVNPDKKPAYTLINKSPQLISGLLVFIGRPLFFILSTILISALFVINITGHIIRTILTSIITILSHLAPNVSGSLVKLGAVIESLVTNISKKALKEHGVIFTSSNIKLKIFLLSLKKSGKRYFEAIQKKAEILVWKTEVFLLVLEKLTYKFFNFLKEHFSFYRFLESLKISFLSLKLKVFLFFASFPKPQFKHVPALKIATYIFTMFFIIATFTGIAFWHFILKDLPSPQKLTQRKIPLSTRIYDRNGVLLYTIFKDQKRTPIPIKDIPIHVRLATIAAEDAEFYSHPGFSIRGIARAVTRNLKNASVEGGSTITQQLVKNALLTPEKTLTRKLKEITLAIEVEMNYSKDEILEMYLNEVSYGGTAYGIQEAARMYFDKDAKDLNLAEAALLAGLPKSPTLFSPFGANPEKAKERQREVLHLMQVNGFITEKQKKEAESYSLNFSDYKETIKAPHFVFYVRQALEEKYGKELVESGGLEVTTTLDYQIQQFAEKVLYEEVEKLSSLNVTNGAIVVLNPQSGEILAMVGSKNYFDTEHDGNVNVATRPRQPGSSIKIVNYAYALSNGLTAATLVNDSPITFNVDGQPPYTPKNYEGGYRGTLTVRSAFAESRNIPAVKVLASYGVDKMIEMGKKMGITTWKNPNNYGLSLTLGGGEVKLIDLARVYATVANYGRRPELVSTLKVINYEGRVLEEFSCSKDTSRLLTSRVIKINAHASEATEAEKIAVEDSYLSCSYPQVLDPKVAFLITDILRDNKARAPSFGENSLLNIAKHSEVAVKTGTSNNLRDNLTVGYTQDYVVAVWVGNNDNSPMSRIASGVTGATPIWNKIMSALLSEKSNHDWPVPEGLVRLPICPITGTLACDGCPIRMEWFLEENKPEKACNPEWIKKYNEQKEEKKEKDKDEQNNELRNLAPQNLLDKTLEIRFGRKKKQR